MLRIIWVRGRVRARSAKKILALTLSMTQRISAHAVAPKKLTLGRGCGCGPRPGRGRSPFLEKTAPTDSFLSMLRPGPSRGPRPQLGPRLRLRVT